MLPSYWKRVDPLVVLSMKASYYALKVERQFVVTSMEKLTFLPSRLLLAGIVSCFDCRTGGSCRPVMYTQRHHVRQSKSRYQDWRSGTSGDQARERAAASGDRNSSSSSPSRRSRRFYLSVLKTTNANIQQTDWCINGLWSGGQLLFLTDDNLHRKNTCMFVFRTNTFIYFSNQAFSIFISLNNINLHSKCMFKISQFYKYVV